AEALPDETLERAALGLRAGGRLLQVHGRRVPRCALTPTAWRPSPRNDVAPVVGEERIQIERALHGVPPGVQLDVHAVVADPQAAHQRKVIGSTDQAVLRLDPSRRPDLAGCGR